MAMIHGRTATGALVPIKVAADGSLSVGTISPGAITIDNLSIEGLFGGTPEHWNGTAGAAPATVTFSKKSRSILFDNTGDTNALLFSLDGGTKFKTLPPESSICVNCDRTTVVVKTAGAPTTTYEIIAVVAEV